MTVLEQIYELRAKSSKRPTKILMTHQAFDRLKKEAGVANMVNANLFTDIPLLIDDSIAPALWRFVYD